MNYNLKQTKEEGEKTYSARHTLFLAIPQQITVGKKDLRWWTHIKESWFSLAHLRYFEEIRRFTISASHK